MFGRGNFFAMSRPTPLLSVKEASVIWRDCEGRSLEVAIRRHPQSRRLRLTVDDAGARITAPVRASRVSIERFVAEHRPWIARQLALHAVVQPLAPIAGVEDSLTLRGIPTPVRWFECDVPRVDRGDDGAILIGVPLKPVGRLGLASRALRGYMVAEATRDIAEANDAAQSRVGARATRVSVRPLKSLWGSISVDGSMRIDLALLLAPPEILDYVVVHEACHRHERNHGPRFWAHVARAHPDYRDHRRWLRTHGPALKSELSRWLDALARAKAVDGSGDGFGVFEV